MKRRVIWVAPGHWMAFNEKGKKVNEITKTPKGWELSQGEYRHKAFDCFNTARRVAFCGVDENGTIFPH